MRRTNWTKRRDVGGLDRAGGDRRGGRGPAGRARGAAASILAVIGAAALVAPAAGAAGAPAERAVTVEVTVEDLAWLAGCWRPEGGEAGSLEQWTAPAGGTMLGLSRTVREGATRGFEFLLIRDADDGPVYVARPGGGPPTEFRWAGGGERRAEFANPEHDFPKRIVYELEDGGRLAARIEGEADGETRSVPFSMRRVPCE